MHYGALQSYDIILRCYKMLYYQFTLTLRNGIRFATLHYVATNYICTVLYWYIGLYAALHRVTLECRFVKIHRKWFTDNGLRVMSIKVKQKVD